MIALSILYAFAAIVWFVILGVSAENADDWDDDNRNAKLYSRLALLASVWPIALAILLAIGVVELIKLLKENVRIAFARS